MAVTVSEFDVFVRKKGKVMFCAWNLRLAISIFHSQLAIGYLNLSLSTHSASVDQRQI